jgi:hypothetical protein
MTGAELVRMMREHKITIVELAGRMDVPKKTIRRRRHQGVSMPACLEYAEAIRGHLTEQERVEFKAWRERREFGTID